MDIVSLYADDVIMFLHPKESDIQLVLKILEIFGEASGSLLSHVIPWPAFFLTSLTQITWQHPIVFILFIIDFGMRNPDLITNANPLYNCYFLRFSAHYLFLHYLWDTRVTTHVYYFLS
ncbi:hypothetical protein ACJX0J_015880, partial [Zea mays]